MTPLYIFDLDGTLALIDHRRHFVEGPKAGRDWPAFYAACVGDRPNWPVISTLKALQKTAEIWIFSGRSEVVLAETVEWLRSWVGPGPWNLTMRPEGSTTADTRLKHQWYFSMLPQDQARLVAVFEDRARMVEMWRAIGVPCFQVAEGDF